MQDTYERTAIVAVMVLLSALAFLLGLIVGALIG